MPLRWMKLRKVFEEAYGIPPPGEEPPPIAAQPVPLLFPTPSQPYQGSPEPDIVPQPAPYKLATIGANPELADYRVATWWVPYLERGWNEAIEKLHSIVKNDFKEDTDKLEFLPCIIDLKEARTKREEAAIERVHRRFARLFAGFVDRMVRYTPEYRFDAFDYLQQEVINWKPLYSPYECKRFRATEEEETKPRKRRKVEHPPAGVA